MMWVGSSRMTVGLPSGKNSVQIAETEDGSLQGENKQATNKQTNKNKKTARCISPY